MISDNKFPFVWVGSKNYVGTEIFMKRVTAQYEHMVAVNWKALLEGEVKHSELMRVALDATRAACVMEMSDTVQSPIVEFLNDYGRLTIDRG